MYLLIELSLFSRQILVKKSCLCTIHIYSKYTCTKFPFVPQCAFWIGKKTFLASPLPLTIYILYSWSLTIKNCSGLGIFYPFFISNLGFLSELKLLILYCAVLAKSSLIWYSYAYSDILECAKTNCFIQSLTTLRV